MDTKFSYINTQYVVNEKTILIKWKFLNSFLDVLFKSILIS